MIISIYVASIYSQFRPIRPKEPKKETFCRKSDVSKQNRKRKVCNVAKFGKNCYKSDARI